MSNEWNLMKELEPPIGEPLIVTVYDKGRNQYELRYPVYYCKSLYTDEYSFTMLSHEGICHLLPEYSKVVAWQVFSKPYEIL